MRKSFIFASSVMLVSASLLSGCQSAPKEEQAATETTQAAAPAPVAPVATPAAPAKEEAAPAAKFADPLERSSVFGDFHHYEIGDTVPALYRSKTYNIAKWQLRKLPAPVADSHWTYMGGDYILISDAEGKILRIFSGDIIYR